MPEEALVRMRSGVDIRNRQKTITTLPCVVERLTPRGTLEDDGSSRNLQFILKVGGKLARTYVWLEKG